EVGAAHPGAEDPQQQVGRPAGGHGQVADLGAGTRGGFHDRLHGSRQGTRGSRWRGRGNGGGGIHGSSTSRRASPVCDPRARLTASGVPAATTVPPWSPPSGPRSISQSALLITSRWCSITTTV